MNLDALAPPVKFEQLTGDEIRLCQLIGNRARFLGEQMRERNPLDGLLEVHPDVVAMDVGIVHLRRGLNLKAFFDAENLTFLREYATIQMHINRACKFFPADVPLTYALNSRRMSLN